MGLSPQSPLTPDEAQLLGHLRRLKKHARDFKIELYGSFKAGRRVIELRPTAYERYETDELSRIFEAID